MTKVLIVDDNELYRQAFSRNLTIMDYDVVEAENADEAVKAFEESSPDLVVTDLSMRTPTEGLELIRSLKNIDPLAPIVLISAVGTFEEGSLAKELGAERVLSKQKIDEQIDELYGAIEQAKATGDKLRELRQEIAAINSDPDSISHEEVNRLREIIAQPNQHPTILTEAYDQLIQASSWEIRAQLEAELSNSSGVKLEETENQLKTIFPEFHKFDDQTRKELITAEFFYIQQGGDTPADNVDFSRNIGFSYCFAVENEAKSRLKRKLNRFLSDRGNVKLVKKMMDDKLGQLDLFYHQYLLRLQQQYNFDFTMDNVRQVFQRIMEHEGRYKPDGLKALGIMIVCFGRDYTVKGLKGNLKIGNPLSLKNFESDEEVLRFAQSIVSLQHYRNPYIHPEISEMEKISKIRDTAFDCLGHIAKIA